MPTIIKSFNVHLVAYLLVVTLALRIIFSVSVDLLLVVNELMFSSKDLCWKKTYRRCYPAYTKSDSGRNTKLF